jgi:hypothetical protein
VIRESKILLERPEGKVPRGRLRSKWEGDIKMGHTQTQWAWPGFIYLKNGAFEGLIEHNTGYSISKQGEQHIE